MGITAVTSSGGAFASSLLQSVASQLRATGGSSANNGSTFGPAFLLGGSAPNFGQGLYNSLGSLLSAGKTEVPAGSSAPPSQAQQQRDAKLKAIADRIDAGDIQGGRAEAQLLLDKNASDVSALHLVAHSYFVEHDYKQAERYYARASTLAPSNARLKSDLANARVMQKSDDEVLADARRKLRSPIHRADGLRLLFRLSARSPDNAEVYLALADGFDAAGKPLQVAGAIQEALKRADDQQINEVVTRAEKLAASHPHIGLPHNILGQALQKAGRLNEAIEELEIAANLAPYNIGYSDDLADGYVARALTRLEAGNVVSAQIDVRAAQAINPANSSLDEASARVAAHRARQDIARGSFNGALAKLRTAYSKTPSDPQFKRFVAGLYLRVAYHFQNQSNESQALASYIKAYELDPTSSTARRNVAELSHSKGQTALSANQYDQAITHLKRAYDTYRVSDSYGQDLANAYDLRGQYHMNLDELDEAIEDFETGLALDPSNTSLGTNLANALAQSSGT